MPAHRVLSSVVHDVAHALVSRNDDLGGYWALGQLVSYALANRTDKTSVDLTCGESSPSLQETAIRRIPAQWTEVFWRNVGHQKLQRAVVTRASVVVTFEFAGRASSRGALLEYPVTLEVVVEDDRGRAYSRSLDIWCSPHDPKLEVRSVRGA
jgi:hypothetical protein